MIPPNDPHLQKTRYKHLVYSGLIILEVPRTRLELARPYEHQPLKLACLPISTPGRFLCLLSFKFWCPEQDSNLHNLAVTSP